MPSQARPGRRRRGGAGARGSPAARGARRLQRGHAGALVEHADPAIAHVLRLRGEAGTGGDRGDRVDADHRPRERLRGDDRRRSAARCPSAGRCPEGQSRRRHVHPAQQLGDAAQQTHRDLRQCRGRRRRAAPSPNGPPPAPARRRRAGSPRRRGRGSATSASGTTSMPSTISPRSASSWVIRPGPHPTSRVGPVQRSSTAGSPSRVPVHASAGTSRRVTPGPATTHG